MQTKEDGLASNPQYIVFDEQSTPRIADDIYVSRDAVPPGGFGFKTRAHTFAGPRTPGRPDPAHRSEASGPGLSAAE